MSTIERAPVMSVPEPLVEKGIEYPFYSKVGVAEVMTEPEAALARNQETIFVWLSHRLGIGVGGESEYPDQQPHTFYRHPEVSEDDLNGIFNELEQKYPEHFDANIAVQPISVRAGQEMTNDAMHARGIVPQIHTVIG